QARKPQTSNSMEGVIEPTSAVEPFYRRFYVKRQIYAVGTGQVDSPFASYVGLLGETGLIGFSIYLRFYLAVFRLVGKSSTVHRTDSNVFPLITASMGFLVYTLTVSLYNPWMETGRMTTILWLMIAIVCQYGERCGNEKDKANTISDRVPSSSSYRA